MEQAYGEQHWWVIALSSPYEADGDIIGDLLVRIRSIVDFSYTVIGNVEGAGTYHVAEDRSYSCHAADDLIPLVKKARRFDWCDILCYRSVGSIPDGDLWDIPFPDLVATTEVTVQAVDGGGIEIATKSVDLYRAIWRAYPVEMFYYGSLQGYVFMR